MTTLEQIEQMVKAKASYFSSETDNSVFDKDTEYMLTLKVNYETFFGQEIGIVGNIPQLGLWDTSRALKMKWTTGHVWVAEDISISESKGDPTYFMYKYVLLQNGNFQFYEQGLDRIADLKLLKE